MASGRDDFVIAFRSAFLKKKDKQRFSLLTLIILSIVVIILGNRDFKVIQIIKSGINEITYRSSYMASIPENKIKKINIQIKEHLNLYKKYKNNEIEFKILEEKKYVNDFLKLENEKLRNLINENINSEEVLAKVLIDKESPYLKSVILNKGSKDKIKIGMAVMDSAYLVGQIIEVNFTNSRALLLSDLNSKIPVILQPEWIQAVASGTGKNYGLIEYTKEDLNKESSEMEKIVYTSGRGGLFKPGVPVGKISKYSNNKIIFFSDFDQLDYVKIVSFNIEGNN